MGKIGVTNLFEYRYVHVTKQPLLRFEWVMLYALGFARQRVTGERSPANRPLDALNPEIHWPMAGYSIALHPAMETKAATD
jgi:hypothetical protein